LADATGTQLSADDALRGHVDLRHDADDTFFTSLNRLCRENGIDVYPSSAGPRKLRLQLVPRTQQPWLAGPTVEAGPVLVVARSAERTSSITLGDEAPTPAGTLRYSFDALLAPRYQIGSRDFTIEWSRATDRDGQSLLVRPRQEGGDPVPSQAVGVATIDFGGDASPTTPEPVYSTGQWRSGRLRFGLNLDPDTPASAGPVTVAGTIHGTIGGELYDAEQVGRGWTTWVVAGEAVRVHLLPGESRDGRAVWSAAFHTGRPVSEKVGRLLAESLASARLVLGDGSEARRGRVQAGAAAVGWSYEVTFTATHRTDAFVGPRQVVRLDCEVPRDAVRLAVPFRLDGLPLP
jgi:hypothetical protein